MSLAQVVMNPRVLVRKFQSTLEFLDSFAIIVLGQVKNAECVKGAGIRRLFPGLEQTVFNTPQTAVLLKLRRTTQLRQGRVSEFRNPRFRWTSLLVNGPQFGEFIGVTSPG